MGQFSVLGFFKDFHWFWVDGGVWNSYKNLIQKAMRRVLVKHRCRRHFGILESRLSPSSGLYKKTGRRPRRRPGRSWEVGLLLSWMLKEMGVWKWGLGRLCVRMEKLGFYWTDFENISYFRVFRKSVEKSAISLRYVKNGGHFKWIPVHIYGICPQILFRMSNASTIL